MIKFILDYFKKLKYRDREPCTCDKKQEYCDRYIEATPQGALIFHGRMSCGKFKDELNELMEKPFFKQMQKDIKEKGYFRPSDYGYNVM